ncbi:hypothetical protein SRHO_G00140800 [Serrasalmus rhombeus]
MKPTTEKTEITHQSDCSGLLITLSVCVALLLIVVIGESALIYKLIHNRTRGSVSTNTERRSQNKANGDYEDPLEKQNISTEWTLLNQREREMNSVVLSVKMWLCVFLLYSVLQESSGCTVDRGFGGTITRSAGDSVELPCSCEQQTKEDPQTVQWGFKKNFIQGDYRADHSVFPEDGSQKQRYRGRVQRLNKPGTVALIISHLTEEDEGTYVCGNNGNYNRAVTLQVSTGSAGCEVLSLSERTFSRSSGESVLLHCPCPPDQHRINPDRVTWTKDQTAVSNDTESYRGRVWMFDQNHSRNFSLLISDLTKEDSGVYTCRADEKDMPFVQLEVTGQSVKSSYSFSTDRTAPA